MDVNLLAFRIVEEATSDAPPDKARQAASRKGGLIGGHARARSISKERRLEIAHRASEARWKNKKSPAA